MPRRSLAPPLEELKALLRKMPQCEIARRYNVSEAAVSKWRIKMGLTSIKKEYTHKAKQRKHKKKKQRAKNKRFKETIECNCGCGAIIKRYKWYANSGWQERRYVRGHGGGRGVENKRLKQAIKFASKFGTRNQKDCQRENQKWSTDFTEEYLGEAWIALVEGRNPQEAIIQQFRQQAPSKRILSIHDDVRSGDNSEQLANYITDDNKLSNFRP